VPAVFGWWGKKTKTADPHGTRLAALVAAHMPGADEPTVRIVAAIAGLLGQIAYADHDYSATEERHIREGLEGIEGLGPGGVDAVCEALREHIGEISAVDAPRHARALRDLADRDLRLHVLDLLIDLAAADDKVLVSETNVLRHTVTALGLSQDDYNLAQARHRDKLTVLK
jgi:uncharacterized tellurite resistance protein B-like protein